MFDYLSRHEWLYTELGSGKEKQNGREALAWQDTFIRYIMELNPQSPHQPKAILHFYHLQHPSVLLGPRDRLLSTLPDALTYLQQHQYAIHFRAHGGLAVISDAGILNISFISDLSQFPLSINDAYEQMVHLIRLSLMSYHLQVESYEVIDSYCPGAYDIVLNKKKIGGIAQRRFKNGVAIAAYISVNGNQTERANIIRNFYQLGNATEQYPKVEPSVMASISDFLDFELTIDAFKERLFEVIAKFSTINPLSTIPNNLQNIFNDMEQKALERNQQLPLSD